MALEGASETQVSEFRVTTKLIDFYSQRINITVNSEIFPRVYFRETLRVQSFAKIKPSRNGEIILSFSDLDKSGPSRNFFTSQIFLLTPFAKL